MRWRGGSVDASYRWRRVVGGHWFSKLTSATAAVHECRVPFTRPAVAVADAAAAAAADHVDVLSDLAVQCQELLLSGHAVERLDSRSLPFGPFHLRQSLPHVPRDQVGPFPVPRSTDSLVTALLELWAVQLSTVAFRSFRIYYIVLHISLILLCKCKVVISATKTFSKSINYKTNYNKSQKYHFILPYLEWKKNNDSS